MTDPFSSAMFVTVTKMVTAAPMMFEEPVILGTLRIMESASVLVKHLEANGVTDPFLSDFHTEWENNKAKMMSNPDQYAEMLDDIATRFVREAKRRNQD
ncbi:MAG TPA: DUF6092 family protein [Jatrophihabitans sp.]|jgi:hypothetical protein